MKKFGSNKNPIIEESPKRFTRGDAKRQAKFKNVDQKNEAEDDEDVKSISSDDVIDETKKKKRKSKGKKEGKNIKKAEEEAQVESEDDVLYEKSNSHNERLPVGENNESEEEEEVRKLTKAKIKKGLESESEGEEQLKKVTKPKKGKGSKSEKPYPTFELPSALAYHAIDHFHPRSMELRLEKGSIKATRQKVHDMLGIPMGSRKLEDLEQRPSNDPFIKEWEEQFKHVQKPTPAAIALVISHTTEADLMFQRNFITLFESTMGTLDNGGRVSTKLLKRITEDVDISDIDWCGYILDCLHTSKKNWKDMKTRKNFYYKPLTFLCLLYLDSTIFQDLRVLHHRPALRSWNTATRKKRIKMETKTRCLGKLEHHGEFDPEEEQDGMNVYKGLDVYVINDKEPETKKEYYEKIVLKLDIIFNERSELVRTLRNGVKNFEDNHIMIDFCKQYGGLFNDNEFNLYVSSKDDDSEGEPDGDNENKNHDDDDGAPTADANKQKESENQKKEQNKEENDKKTEESRSEGIEESRSEGTKVNVSEGTEGGSDGKEEKMNGDDREVTVQMDVDNQNEEINKQKDAIESEDSDNMNNNEMKNDSVQEKQDADKDENTEKEKVKTKKESRIKLIRLTMFKRNKMMIRKKLLRMNFRIHRLLTHEKYMFKWKNEDEKKYDKVKKYKAFSDTMKNEFKKDDELKK
nr:hypothetical protein [Tanacetum cinerariifolium]